ncbi:hypothetical protein [Pelagibius sp. Alg239-R121]|uniref:hypothetical protein n=1 Tax=Pelagibius sp. Alg239-R121 TaxID=2993448 RepID=UPI0024A6BA8F|nr:hypothetical protein [Pelagibius sp. Alg239-R121]
MRQHPNAAMGSGAQSELKGLCPTGCPSRSSESTGFGRSDHPVRDGNIYSGFFLLRPETAGAEVIVAEAPEPPDHGHAYAHAQ